MYVYWDDSENRRGTQRKQHVSALSATSAVNLFCHDLFIQNKLKSHKSLCTVLSKYGYTISRQTGSHVRLKSNFRDLSPTCITEHPRAVCHSVWLGRARCFLNTIGGRRDDETRISYSVLHVFEVAENDLDKGEARTRYTRLDYAM